MKPLVLTSGVLAFATTVGGVVIGSGAPPHLTSGSLVKSAARPLHVRIDGRWYDVTDWASKHPGGRYVLEWADGFDMSGAFHTIHLFSGKRAADMLKHLPEAKLDERELSPLTLPQIKYVPVERQQTGAMDTFMAIGENALNVVEAPLLPREESVAAPAVPADVPRVPATNLPWKGDDGTQLEPAYSETALRKDLSALLRRRFKSPAEYKATPEHWARVFGALALFGCCFSGYLHGGVPETLVLPFAQWLVFSPTVHESSHSTLSTKPWVNKAASFCALPYIYNPYIWWPEHIVSHHQYTNDDDLDVDLHHLRPARLHPGCEADPAASGFNFLFKGCFSTIGMSVLWPLRVLTEGTTGRWYDNLITPIPASVSSADFALSTLPVGFVLFWPVYLVASGQVDPAHAAFLWLYPWLVTGAIWTVLTQVSHVQQDCQQVPAARQDYFRYQIEASVDYSVYSSLVPKLTASLNYQSLHHVMPSVCGCHFHELYPEYADICRKHGVRLNTRPDLWSAWRSCVERVFQLSSPELTPAWTEGWTSGDVEPAAGAEGAEGADSVEGGADASARSVG